MKINSTLVVLVLAATACGNDDEDSDTGKTMGNDSELVNEATDKLKECDLFIPNLTDQDATIEDDYDRCAAECVIAASCAQLVDLSCSEQPDSDSSLVACVIGCPEAPADGYACADGTKIPHAALCDGDEQCADGADEQGCKGFECADGETLELEISQCDGFEDCADGSDEADCAGACG